MIAKARLNEEERTVLVAIRAACDLAGFTPEAKELARLAGTSTGECLAAIRTLQERGYLLTLPDGGLAPREGVSWN